MAGKYGSFLGDFLTLVGEAAGFEWPPEYSEAWRKKQLYGPREKYYHTVWQAKKKGLVKEVSKNGKSFLELTQKGQLEQLVSRMGVTKQENWDGKWRMVIFDIPEEAHDKRDHLRRLLKRQGFVKLQASVLVSPYSLNREALTYLKNSGLMQYIRIGKIEEFDEDSDLRRKFKL